MISHSQWYFYAILTTYSLITRHDGQCSFYGIQDASLHPLSRLLSDKRPGKIVVYVQM